MAPTPSEPTPTTPSELLERARSRGARIRTRRRLAGATGVAAVALAAIVLPVSLTGGPGGRHVVQVATEAGTSTLPPSAASSPETTTRSGPETAILQPTATTATSVARATVTTPTISSPTTRNASQTTPTTVPTATASRTVTNADNGQSVSIRVGSTLVVRLAADNWMIGPSSQPSVLAMQGTPNQQATPCGYPGGVCGSTTATFLAQMPGQAQVSASRYYCGEAIRCTPSSDSWLITVTVIS